MERLQTRTARIMKQLSDQRDKADPSSSDYGILQETQEQLEIYRKDYDRNSEALYDVETNPTAIDADEVKAGNFQQDMRTARMDCKQLMSAKKTHSNTQALERAVGGLTAAYDAAPEKNHSVALDVVLVRAKDLEQELLTSTMPEDHDLRDRATAILKKAYLIQAKSAGEAIHDVKPTTADLSIRSHLKLKPLDVPNFSGKTEDWLTFWRRFSTAIHNNRDLDDQAKLSYLIQSLQEKSVKATYSERMEEERAYQKIIKELQTEHDKPRWMHRNTVSP